ncbi:hypothetical protein [Mammaliicoccus fleurettii]|uniref:hypothetical protein n=1 Tax=Mammaliicoccus fleurettii TaxID=150056 RepID=UPI001AAC6734|nr:hypothetical protein [Mammaliicoccus fleurettii]MBO3061321.1 hypothetical protein [Mammaliicoccus fleurettii]MEB7780856.1 hypothetical protein [Mammaliicoccus fleurettii]
MYLGVILNRVFRTKDNPLFHYIEKHQNELNKLYFILPLEVFMSFIEDEKLSSLF